MKTVAFYTLGCKVNQYETNAMIEMFIKEGYEIVDFESKSDIYIVNTCTVTNMSDRKSRQIIRRAKQINPDSILVVTGCYAQIPSKEIEKIDDIDLIIGNTEKKDIVKLVENLSGSKIDMTDINCEKEYTDFGTTTYTEKTRAVVKVQDGCNNFCSYCIIPYSRGRIRSRKINSIIDEVKCIANSGIKEVVITGIDISSYGIDFKNENIRLIDLLEKINKIDEIKRIRLGSLEPNIITDEFIKRLKNVDKICKHFHLSLQSGCTETLKRMNRKYTTDEFEEVACKLRNVFPDVMLTTDIIVGFPGETDEEFDITYEYLKKIKFYKMHIFKYSQRKGTRAAVMPNQIDSKIKEERSKILLELSDKNEKEYLKKYIGKNVEVLFEQQEGKYIKGHTENYLIVKTNNNNNNDYSNKIINTIITDIDGLELIGKIET